LAMKCLGARQPLVLGGWLNIVFLQRLRLPSTVQTDPKGGAGGI
jgi:hypothetical protein